MTPPRIHLGGTLWRLLPLLVILLSSTALGDSVGSAATGSPTSAFLGPFHMVLLHFPIGLLLFAGLLELVAWIRPFDGLRRVQGFTLGFGVLTAILTSMLGLYRAHGGEYAEEILQLHRNRGIAFTIIAALTLVLHRALGPTGTNHLWVYRVALGVTLVLLLDASHHGGTLTHGQGFLTQNAPGPIRALIQRLETSTPRPTARAGLRTDEIRSAAHRVFESKCHSCHGPQKQKGKYRMDQRDSLIRGGSSGEAAVVPGDPGQSRLFRQIVLPKEHDDVMPPSGKEPLDDTEVLAVLRWIQAGAP